jgi:hypothetical protein
LAGSRPFGACGRSGLFAMNPIWAEFANGKSAATIAASR